MHTIELKNHKVKLFDSIKDLIISRFVDYQRACLVDAEIGSIEDFDEHFNKIITLVRANKEGETIQALSNLRIGIYMAQVGSCTKHYTFAFLGLGHR